MIERTEVSRSQLRRDLRANGFHAFGNFFKHVDHSKTEGEKVPALEYFPIPSKKILWPGTLGGSVHFFKKLALQAILGHAVGKNQILVIARSFFMPGISPSNPTKPSLNPKGNC